MKKGLLIFLISGLVISAAGCGSSKRSEESGDYAAAGAAAPVAKSANYDFVMDNDAAFAEEAEYSSAMEAAPEAEAPEIGEAEAESGKPRSKRKLITTVNISTETDDVEAFADSIEKKVNSLGGYIESSNIYSDRDYYGNKKTKSADITARIPADNLEDFLSAVDGNSNITSRSRNTEDVTLQYADTEAHERALSLEQKSLEEMMLKAETIDDIMAIQTQLTDVRYRLDSIRSQIRTYDNNISYSTVYLNITETKEFTVTKEETVWERISKGFVDNLMDVMDAAAEFLIWFITHIPALLIAGAIIFAIIMLIRAIAGSAGKKKKAAAKQMAAAQPVKTPVNTLVNTPAKAKNTGNSPETEDVKSEQTSDKADDTAEEKK